MWPWISLEHREQFPEQGELSWIHPGIPAPALKVHPDQDLSVGLKAAWSSGFSQGKGERGVPEQNWDLLSNGSFWIRVNSLGITQHPREGNSATTTSSGNEPSDPRVFPQKQLPKPRHLQAKAATGRSRCRGNSTNLWNLFLRAPSHVGIKDPNPISHPFAPLACRTRSPSEQFRCLPREEKINS